MLNPLRTGVFGLALCLAALPAGARSSRAATTALPEAPVPSAHALPTPAPAVPVMPIAEVRRGQKGYGVSVFSGTARERFDVEVLGVIHDMSPNVSYVLAKLSGRGLEQSGVIAGMSGSPVYIDGKLVGAVAFSWPFAKEAIAGITPIEAMRNLRGGPPPPGAVPTAAGMASTRDLAALLPAHGDVSALLPELAAASHTAASYTGRGRVSASDPDAAPLHPDSVVDSREELAAEIGRLKPIFAGQGSSVLGWSFSGFAPQTQELFARALGTGVTPSGQASAAEVPSDLQPGDAVAAVLVDGDLRMAATGTVTDRVDQDVLAFGHPFLGLGSLDVPMAGAEVVAVVSSEYSSFKIANFGPAVGAFRRDRMTGIVGTMGAQATTLPLDVHVVSGSAAAPGPPIDYHLRVARVPQITPMLLATSVLGAQEAAAQSTGPLGVDLDATFDLGPQGKLELVQSFDGENAPTDAAVNLLRYGDFFLNNGFAPIELRRVDVRVRQHPAPRTAAIVAGYADKTEVHPGETVKLHVDVVPWRGTQERRDLALKLPADLPAGRYSVLVGDGVTIDAARQALEPAQPMSVDQALRTVRSFHSRRDLVAIGLYQGSGLSVAGEVMPRLPGSLRSVWSAASSQTAVPLPLVLAQQEAARSDMPLDGGVRIDLRIVRKAPWSGSNAARDDDGGDAPAAAGDDDSSGASTR